MILITLLLTVFGVNITGTIFGLILVALKYLIGVVIIGLVILGIKSLINKKEK